MDTKIGLHYGYWAHIWDTDYAYYIKKAANLGFDIVELNSVPFVDMDKKRVDEVRNAAMESGVQLTFCGGLKNHNDVSSPDLDRRKKGVQDLYRMCETVKYMGGTYISGILHGVWPCHYGLNGEMLDDKRPYLDRAAKSVREAAKNAEDMGIILNLEVVNRFEQFTLNTAREGLDFISMVDRPNVRLLLDSFHMNIEEHSITGAIEEAGAMLGHFHVGENNRMPPHKEGMLDWEGITGALKKIKYEGAIVMEPFVQMGGEVGRDICVWRDIVTDVSEENLDKMIVESLHYIKGLIQPSLRIN